MHGITANALVFNYSLIKLISSEFELDVCIREKKLIVELNVCRIFFLMLYFCFV